MREIRLQAAKIAERAAERFPNLARAIFEHGFYLQKQGSFIRGAPVFLGDLMMKAGRTEDAIPYLQTAIRIRRDYIPARALLARALLKRDEAGDFPMLKNK